MVLLGCAVATPRPCARTHTRDFAPVSDTPRPGRRDSPLPRTAEQARELTTLLPGHAALAANRNEPS